MPTHRRSLEAAIFDLGGVVFRISFRRVFESWARSLDVDPQEIAAKFRFDAFYERLERGEISAESYRAHVADLLGVNLSREQFDRGWNNLYLEVTPGIDFLLRQLRRRLRLVSLTNTNAIHAPVWRVRYAPVLSHFEKIFCSHEIGARKPEPAAYRTVLDYLGVKAGKVIFVDDDPENVATATRLGMQAFVVTGTAEIAVQLRTLGVEIG